MLSGMPSLALIGVTASWMPESATQLQRQPPANPGLPALQDDLRALARSRRRPLAVLIWLVSALASGALTLAAAIFLPLFYKFLSATGFSNKSQRALRQDEADAQELLREQRETLSAIAEAAHPFRDDERT